MPSEKTNETPFIPSEAALHVAKKLRALADMFDAGKAEIIEFDLDLNLIDVTDVGDSVKRIGTGVETLSVTYREIPEPMVESDPPAPFIDLDYNDLAEMYGVQHE